MNLRTPVLALAALALALGACGDDDDTTEDVGSSDDASVEIVNLADGDEVSSPVTIEMVATGLEVEPAGEVVDGAGHFHLMVDVSCVEVGEVIPGDTEGYNHFGKAQTEAELELEPGEHTICLQAGDGIHTALDLIDEVTITVVE